MNVLVYVNIPVLLIIITFYFMKFVTRFVFLFLSYDMLKMNFECTIFSPLEIFCKSKKKMCKQMISSQGLCMYIVRPQQKDGSLITSIPSTKRYVKYLMFPFSPWHFFPFFPADYEKKNSYRIHIKVR